MVPSSIAKGYLLPHAYDFLGIAHALQNNFKWHLNMVFNQMLSF